MESTDPTDSGLHLEVHGAMNTQIVILRNKRASLKRRITNTIKKLKSSIEQFVRKGHYPRICSYAGIIYTRSTRVF